MTGVPVARDAGTERDSDGNSDSDSDGETLCFVNVTISP